MCGLRLSFGLKKLLEIVLAPWLQNVPSYVIYFNVERNKIKKFHCFDSGTVKSLFLMLGFFGIDVISQTIWGYVVIY